MKKKRKMLKENPGDFPEKVAEREKNQHPTTYLSYIDLPDERAKKEESTDSSLSLSEVFDLDYTLRMISKKISTEDLELFGSYMKDPFLVEDELRAAAKIFENLCKKLDEEEKSVFFDVVYELADGRWTTLNGLLKSLPREDRIAFSEHIFKTIPLLSFYTSL